MSGLCHCGCGGLTPLATRTNARTGLVKGQPTRWLRGHRRAGGRTPYATGPMYVVDEVTGCWVWARGRAGNGYGQLVVKGKQRLAHRWFYLQRYGDVPPMLDHVCRNRACVNHLRPATPAQNAQNLGARNRYRGVTFDRGTGRWRATVHIGGVTHRLGRFDTEEQAAAAASAYRAEHMPYSADAAVRRSA
jgi:hypothetical protein